MLNVFHTISCFTHNYVMIYNITNTLRDDNNYFSYTHYVMMLTTFPRALEFEFQFD